ncbi:hypothetical protein [Terrihabitans sp. B22-R8]|uniref:hypothetical protein n=1 Tax=Terrihabitans sp. B22-R8 TaxID=3425128 RepID=UPI00403D10C9
MALDDTVFQNLVEVEGTRNGSAVFYRMQPTSIRLGSSLCKQVEEFRIEAPVAMRLFLDS